jgi:hypothetical protein
MFKYEINIFIYDFFLLLFRYLKEKIKDLTQEKNHAVTNVAKYKVSFSFLTEYFEYFLSSGSFTDSSISIQSLRKSAILRSCTYS